MTRTEREAAMFRFIRENYHAVLSTQPGSVPACLFKGLAANPATARSWDEVEAAIERELEQQP